MFVPVAWFLLINTINSMVSLYASTSGLVPAYKHNINSKVFVFVGTSGLVPAFSYYMNSMVSFASRASKLQSSRMYLNLNGN